MTSRWLLLQLSDGTFPSGGFAHSNGLEAASVLGNVDLERFLDAALRQAGRAALPFVRLARTDLAAADDACDAMMLFRAPNHGSRAQGRALASAALRIWPDLGPLGSHSGPMHHAAIFGALYRAQEIEEPETLAAYLHGLTRSILSAAVRLGIVGPLEAQQLHAARAPLLESIEVAAEPAQTAPLLELYGALHERLDGRMFQS